MPRYDVLRVEGFAGEMAFTANAAVVAVGLTAIVTPPVFQNAGLDSWFEPGDNVLLSSIWPALPYQFGQGAGSHFIQLAWSDGTVTAPVPELINSFGTSLIHLPSACEPLHIEEGNTPPGLLLRVPTALGAAGNRVQLVVLSATLSVSMVNLPAALDGLTFQMAYHLEVKHTLTMGATGP